MGYERIARITRNSGKDAKAYENYQNYRYCYDNGHAEWVALASMCFDFWRGKQWKQNDIAKMIRERRPHLTFNVIESLIRTMKGIQRALRNDVRFMPLHDANMDDATVRDALWMHAQQLSQFDFLESDVYEAGLLVNRSFYRYGVEFDHNTQGQVWVKKPRSQDVVLDPVVHEYHPDTWPQVFYVPWYSKLEIEHEFGKEAAKELADTTMPDWYGIEDKMMAQRVGELPYYQYTGFEDPERVRAYRLLIRQYWDLKNKDCFIDTQTGNTCEIPETWKREQVQALLDQHPEVSTTKRKVKTMRVTTTCENMILQDQDSPYRSYDLVPYYPTFIDGVSMGAVESLIDPQQLFNKITSQELHIINTTANSGWKYKRGALGSMTREEFEATSSRPGFALEVHGDPSTDVVKIEPNQVPQGHDRLSFKADKIMRSLAGVGDQTRGFAREDVAGEAILANQAASDVNFAPWLANLHRSKQILAVALQDCFQDYYTETRVIQINRGSAFKPDMQSVTINQPTPEGAVVNDVTMGKFVTTLIPSPTRSSLSESEFKDLVLLRKELGLQIPDDVMIEMSNVPNKLQLIQRMKGDSNEAQKAKAAAEQRQAELEHQTEEARALKERSAGELNQARAQKFREEAGRDPDAAYERVEMARIGAERDEAHARITYDYAKLHEQARDRKHKTALELTRLDHTARESAKDRRVDIQKAHMQGEQRKAAQAKQGMQRKKSTPSKSKVRK